MDVIALAAKAHWVAASTTLTLHWNG